MERIDPTSNHWVIEMVKIATTAAAEAVVNYPED